MAYRVIHCFNEWESYGRRKADRTCDAAHVVNDSTELQRSSTSKGAMRIRVLLELSG